MSYEITFPCVKLIIIFYRFYYYLFYVIACCYFFFLTLSTPKVIIIQIKNTTNMYTNIYTFFGTNVWVMDKVYYTQGTYLSH